MNAPLFGSNRAINDWKSAPSQLTNWHGAFYRLEYCKRIKRDADTHITCSSMVLHHIFIPLMFWHRCYFNFWMQFRCQSSWSSMIQCLFHLNIYLNSANTGVKFREYTSLSLFSRTSRPIIFELRCVTYLEYFSASLTTLVTRLDWLHETHRAPKTFAT